MAHERLSLPLVDTICRSCDRPLADGHAADCLLAEHEAMLTGDEEAATVHEPDDCYWCAAAQPPALSECRCGNCCRRLLIEVDVEDARREPKIAERCSPIYAAAEMTKTGRRELQGFLLNSSANDYACAFLDQRTSLCTIHETRPLICRLFDCNDSDLKFESSPDPPPPA